MTTETRLRELIDTLEGGIVRSERARLVEFDGVQKLQAAKPGPRKSRSRAVPVALGLVIAVGVWSMWASKSSAVAHLDVLTSRAEFRLSVEAVPLTLSPALAGRSVEMRGSFHLLDDPFVDGSQSLSSLAIESSGTGAHSDGSEAIVIERIELPPGAKWTVDASRRPDLGITIRASDPITVWLYVPDSAEVAGVVADKRRRDALNLLPGAVKLATAPDSVLRLDISALGDGDGPLEFEFHGATGAQIANFDFLEPALGGPHGKARLISAIQSGSVAFNTYGGAGTPRELRFREMVQVQRVDADLLRLRLLEGGLAVSLSGEFWDLHAGSGRDLRPAMPTHFQYLVGENARGYLTSAAGSLLVLVLASMLAHSVRRRGGSLETSDVLETFGG